MAVEKSHTTSMNAKIIGSGKESMVLAYGYGGDQSIWEKMLPHLAQRYRVLIFDWSFSGAMKDLNLYDPEKYSSFDAFAEDLIALMDEVNLTSSVLIAHSMSGMVGCIASIKRPDLFKKLILLAASPRACRVKKVPLKYGIVKCMPQPSDLKVLFESEVPKVIVAKVIVGCALDETALERYLNTEGYEGGFEKADVEQMLLNMESNFEEWVASFAGLVVDARDTVSVDKFGRMLRRMKPEVAISLAKTIFYSDQRDVLEKVHVPCTIVQTSNDVVVPVSVAHFMEKKIKGKTTVEIMEADGHFPQLTAHQLLLDVLDRVLDFNSEEKNL